MRTGSVPPFNGDSCAQCHSTPVSGGVSKFTELHAGHLDASGNFVPATAFIDFGQEPIPLRSLINRNAICAAAQETLTARENFRALRLTLNLWGDGFVEAISDSTPKEISLSQPAGTQGKFITVPALEGGAGTGRFGWKDQHVSLLSFSSDAYLNEMGISNRLAPNRDDVTHQCDTVPDPEDVHNDIDVFARFMRSTKAPPRDVQVGGYPGSPGRLQPIRSDRLQHLPPPHNRHCASGHGPGERHRPRVPGQQDHPPVQRLPAPQRGDG